MTCFTLPFIYPLNIMQTLSTLQASLPLLFKFADLPPFHPNATHGAIPSSSICCSLFLWFPRLMRFSGQTRLTLKIPSTGMIEVHFLWYISWPSLRYFLRFWFCMFSIQVPSFQSFHVSWVFTFVLLQMFVKFPKLYKFSKFTRQIRSAAVEGVWMFLTILCYNILRMFQASLSLECSDVEVHCCFFNTGSSFRYW